MIDIRLSPPLFERELTRDRFDLLLGVVARLEIFVFERLLYCEDEFPIVEFRLQLDRWLRDGLSARVDFEYSSLEHDEAGLVWFRWIPEEHGWRIGSIHREYPENTAWPDDQIFSAAIRFVKDVDRWVREELRVEVSDLLS